MYDGIFKEIKCDKPAEDCRLHCGPSSSTLMYFPPVYDRTGKNTNPDGNITTSKIHCSKCGRKWIHSYSERDGSSLKEIENGEDEPHVETGTMTWDLTNGDESDTILLVEGEISSSTKKVSVEDL